MKNCNPNLKSSYSNIIYYNSNTIIKTCNTILFVFAFLGAFAIGNPAMSTPAEGELEERVEVVTNVSTRIHVLTKETELNNASSDLSRNYTLKKYAFIPTIRRYIWVQAFLL